MVAFFRSLRAQSPGEETLRLHQGAIHFGLARIALGMAATVLAGLSHWFALRRRRGERPVLKQWPLRITVAMLFVLLCLAGLGGLFDC